MATARLEKNILERVTEYVETSLFAKKAENPSVACQTSDGYLMGSEVGLRNSF